MRRLRWQGQLFCVAVLLLCLLYGLLPRWDGRTELLLAVALMSVFGVPHGALDPLFAARLHRMSPARWVLFGLAYAALAASVVALWWALPGVFLLGFLAISSLHFSGDLRHGTSALARLFYGLSVVVLPALLHEAEVAQLFAWLADAKSATQLAHFLHWASWPCLLGLLVSALLAARFDRQTAIEMLAVMAVVVVVTPLLGFTLYFCLMHSARHTLRSQHYAQVSAGALVKAALLPLAGTAALLAVAWTVAQTLAPEMTLDQRVMQVFFVALAALTVPHMALVERVRWSGWSLDVSP